MGTARQPEYWVQSQASRASFCTQPELSEAELDDLRKQTAELREQLQELEEKKATIKSDTAQALKRHSGDLENESKYSITKFAIALLQVPDNLERASSSLKQEDLDQDKELRKMKADAVQMEKTVAEAFKKFGVVKMDAEGDTFDPQKHEAMFAMEMPGKEANTIFHVMEPGYMIHDRTLRPAKVGVVRGLA